MRAMDVTRDELEDVLGSRFVQADGAEPITVRSDRRGPDSVQNDIELVDGLAVSSLDRLHRFTRRGPASRLDAAGAATWPSHTCRHPGWPPGSTRRRCATSCA